MRINICVDWCPHATSISAHLSLKGCLARSSDLSPTTELLWTPKMPTAGRDGGGIGGSIAAASAQNAGACARPSDRPACSNQSAAAFCQSTCKQEISSVWDSRHFTCGAGATADLLASTEELPRADAERPGSHEPMSRKKRQQCGLACVAAESDCARTRARLAMCDSDAYTI